MATKEETLQAGKATLIKDRWGAIWFTCHKGEKRLLDNLVSAHLLFETMTRGPGVKTPNVIREGTTPPEKQNLVERFTGEVNALPRR